MAAKKYSLFALIMALLVLSGCSNKNNQSNTSANDTHSLSSTDTGSSVETDNSAEITTIADSESTTSRKPTDEKKEVQKGEFEIDIVSPDGGGVETRSGSLSDIDLNRPTSLSGTEVFDGWKQEDIIANIRDGSISEDKPLSLTAESIDISNSNNVIYNDVTYVNNGMGSVSIPITVGGNTNFSIIELEISYDVSLLEFESFINKDSDVECNCPEPGVIFISFVSTDNVNADVKLCEIQFKNISAQGSETALKYNIKDIAAWNSDKTGYIEVNHEVINGKIVMF